ncbi:MAG TPA: hypothetical protein VJ505_15525 [Holophagaceae bacterium]|nr:hypothetical protein [Holophagaceae bacterium]
MTLRLLLIQRAARLQQRPAFSCAPWPTIYYAGFRNRVEGVGFGLLAANLEAVHASTGTPWDWMAELAAAAAGLRWDPAAPPVPAGILGGEAFNAEAGRGLFHDREAQVTEDTPFTSTLSQGEFHRRLARLNLHLGWDHDTVARLPHAAWGTPALRGALWSALYAGAHAVLVTESDAAKKAGGWFAPKPVPLEDLEPFSELGL